MKLKIYHIIIFILIVLSTLLAAFFLVEAIKYTATNENKNNGFLFILCFLVLLAIHGLEIYNTAHSLKYGSNFVRVLLYDKKTLQKKGLVITSLCLACFVAILVYAILLRVGLNLPLNNLPYPLHNLTIGLMTLCIIDSIIILMFPLLGKEDISFNNIKD